MTTPVDQRHRAVAPFQPGDALEIQQQSPEIVVLKRTKQAQNAPAKLVSREGRLVFVGEPITTEEVERVARGFPVILPDANLLVAFTWENHEHKPAAEKFFESYPRVAQPGICPEGTT